MRLRTRTRDNLVITAQRAVETRVSQTDRREEEGMETAMAGFKQSDKGERSECSFW